MVFEGAELQPPDLATLCVVLYYARIQADVQNV